MKASVRGRAKFRQDTLDTLSRLLRWSICIMAAAVFTPLWELHIMTCFQYLLWFSSGLVQFYCDIGSILSFWHPWWWRKIKKNSLHPASTFWDQRSLRPTFLLQMERVLVAAMQLGSMKHLDVMSAGNVVAMPCFQVLCGEVSNHQRRIGALPCCGLGAEGFCLGVSRCFSSRLRCWTETLGANGCMESGKTRGLFCIETPKWQLG